jgi:hypothetical protein
LSGMCGKLGVCWQLGCGEMRLGAKEGDYFDVKVNGPPSMVWSAMPPDVVPSPALVSVRFNIHLS